MNEKFDVKKIYESFLDVLKYSNYKILKCYNLVFTKNLITKNIGSKIIFVFILVYLGCFIFFIIKGINPLKDKLKLKSDNKFQSNYLKYNNNKKEENLFKINQETKNKQKINFHMKTSKNNKIKMIQRISTENNNINGTEGKIKFDSYELNELEFYKAIKYDNRSFMQMYFGILKREHQIIFTFFIFDDYNLTYIKFARFIFLLTTDMVMNVLFFTNESMHKLYINYGKYDFIQQIPQILYSTIISKLIDIFLCYLSLTDKPLYQIKSLELKNVSIDEKFKCIYIKFILFFLFTFIFIIFYWYLVSAFCSVYKNTQLAFIKDWICSFIFGILLPFVIYLFPSSLRLYSIKNNKCKYSSFIYKLSQIIPIF